jgi:hypothetical protein
VPDYNLHHQSGLEGDTEGRKRKTDELEDDAFEPDKRKNQKTELGKVATGVFYPGRAERRNSLAISSLITGERQASQQHHHQQQQQQQQQQQHPADDPNYNGFHPDHAGGYDPPEHDNMASFTFGSVAGSEYGSYNGGNHGPYTMEGNESSQVDVKPGHHAMDAKARALLDNGGFDV